MDILATDQQKKHYLLGECKYKNSPIAASDLRQLQAKFQARDSTAEVYYFLFSKSGFTEELSGIAAREGIHLVSAEQIVSDR